MSKIEVTNSAIRINNYEFGDCPRLENYFRIYNPVTHSYYYMGLYYDSDNKILYLPRGIDIWHVESLIGEQAEVLVDKCYKFQRFNDIYIKTLPRDDIQKQALRFTVGAGEYRNTATKSQLCVNLPTGKGKTYITIATLAYFSIRGIVITKAVSWLEQWKERTLEYTNMNPKEICIISGSNHIHRLMNMSNEQIKMYKLFLVTHDTLQSYASSYGWEKVGEFMKKMKIGIKIYDEAHLNFDNMCMIDFYTNVYKTYYLTATPAKSAEKENMIYQLTFKNVPSIDLFDPELDPHTAYWAISFNSNPTPMDISSCKNAYGLDRNAYTNYVVNKQEFYQIFSVVLDIALKKTNNPGEKFMIYIGTNEAIRKVKGWIVENYPELEPYIGIYTSVVSPEEKQEALTKRIIFTTTKSAAAAVDIKGLKLTVVIAEPFKSEVITKQLLGRTRDANTLCIEVVDRGFAQLQRYYHAKLPVFKKYATSCSVIKLTNQELNNKYNKIQEIRSNPRRIFTKIE